MTFPAELFAPFRMPVTFSRSARLFLRAVLALAMLQGANGLFAQQAVQILRSHVRAEVTDHRAALVRSMTTDEQLHLSIVLPLRNQAALTALLGRLYDPSSPDYRKFLSVAEFTGQFGPTADDYNAVVSFAQANGFVVGDAPANRLVVPVKGTVQQVNATFHVSMGLYQHPTEDRTFFSADREPSLALNVPIAHIAGLDSFSLPQPMSKKLSSIKPNAQPLAVTGSGPGGSYLGSDMRAAYYGGTTLTGAGQAVGILEFGGYLLSDVNKSFSNAGQTYNVPINNVLLDGATGGVTYNDDGEQTLDIVQAIGMAPGLSQVRVYIGIGTDQSSILNAMASENIAKQLSCSWSWRPADPTVEDVFFQEMAAQGQSFFTASGDSGAFDAAISPFFYPQEDKYVTSVGGTHLTTSGAAGTWVSETVWNSGGYGSGGGISQDGISIPSWQVGVANSANGGSDTLRNVPDVAMEGDFDNYACSLGVCAEDYAGTSFAAPRWAGYMALVNQQAVEAGNAPTGGLGFINPSVYLIGQGTRATTDLHDITSGNNLTANQPVWFSAVAGYDLTTGWGSANGQSLIDDLAGPQIPGFFIGSATGNVTVNPGSTASTTISVNDAGGFTGSVTLAVTSTLPAGVTASFSPNPATNASVLTFSATSTAADQSIPVTITGTSGTLSAKASFTLGVHAPAFLLAAGAIGLNQGSTSTSTITVTPEYGFTGSVNLTATGLPAGVTASFAPATTNGTSTLTLTASSSVAAGTYTANVTGTSGSLAVNAVLSITIHAPSFSLSNGGSVNIGQGGNGTSYIYVSDLYGFNGSINFAVSGLPAGVTASFSPNPTTGTSVLTLTASTAAAPGTSTLTITGTSGALTSTTSVTLGIFVPTFTLADSGSVSVGQGSTGTSYLYVTDQYGFSGSVNLSVSGLPAGVTALWSQNPTTGYSTLTLAASSTSKVGQYNLTITGTSGTQTATVALSLGIFTPSFTLSAYSVSLGQGTTASSYLYVTPQYGFTGSVALTVTGLPAGVTASFTPNPTTGSSSILLTASSTAALGQYTATITGTSGTQTATTTLAVGVFVPSFTLSAYNPTIGQGTSTTSYVYVYPTYGFTGSVNLSVSGLPAGVTAAFSPNPTTGSSNLILTASATAALGQYTVTVTGTSGTQTVTTTFTLGVYTPTFTVSGGGILNIGQGTTATTYSYIYSQYGFTGSVNLSVTGLPAGVTASFSPNPTTNGSTLQLTASSTAALGQYTLTITGTSGTQTASTTLTLGVYTPAFTLTAYGGTTIGQGSSGTAYVYVSNLYGFTGSVTMAVSGLPSGVTAFISPNPTTGTSTITLSASSSAAIGSSTLTITGTSGSQTATTTILLSIFAPTFSMYASPSSFALDEGTSGTSYIYITQQYGFNGNIAFSATGLPSGVTAVFSPNPGTTSTALTLAVSAAATPGNFTVTVLGTSGSASYSVPISLTISAPSYTISIAPTEANLVPGSTARSSISLVPAHGFAGAVSYAASGLPAGVTASFSPNPATGTSTLTLSASSAASPAKAIVTVTGTSGTSTANTTLSVVVGAAPVGTSTSLALSSGGAAVTSVTAGKAVTATATVTAGSTALTAGQVNFCDATATYCDSIHLLGSAQLTSAGTATLTFIPGAGDHSYKAVFPGTGTNGASVSAASKLSATAMLPTATTITQSGTQGNYTLLATVTGKGPTPPAGNVAFLDTNNGNTAIANATLTGGSGTLTSTISQSIPSGLGLLEIATADFNGDGIPDLAAATSTTLNIMLGKGDGTFAAASASLPIVTTAYSILSGDFDGDGHLDIAVVQSSTNSIAIFLGKGDGTFTASAQRPATGSYPISMVVGDFNHDGVLDLAVANSGGYSVTVQLGNGDGTFTPSQSTIQTSGSPQALAKADFNGDGNLDLAVLSSNNQTVTLLLGNGDGTFSTGGTITSTSYPESIAVGDLNQDGKSDLIVGNSYSSISVYLGNGDGTFTSAPALVSSLGTARLAVADFNGDGKPDIVATPSGYTTVQTFLGNGDGTFSSPVTASTVYGIIDLAVGDWNRDGIPDVATLNNGSVNLTAMTSVVAQTATATSIGVSPVGRGQHLVDASFAGNSAYASSTSGTTTLTSAIASPTVTVGLSSPTITSAQSLTATVKVDGGTGYATPTGSVTLTGGGYTSAATSLNSGGATITIPAGSLAAGSDTLTVTYTPDAASSSAYSTATGSGTVTVGAAVPTVTLGLSASSITTVQSLTAAVTVSGGTGSPAATGSVTLTGGGFTSIAAALNNGGATINIPAGALAAGTDSLTASYTPDAASAAIYSSSSGTNSVTVSKVTPTVSLNLSASSITAAQSLTATVAVSAGSGTLTPTGSVILTGGGFTSIAATLNNGSATINIPAGALAAGTDSLTASYTPDTASASVYITASGTNSVTVGKVTPTVSLNLSASSITAAQPLTATVAVSGGTGTPTPTGSIILTGGGFTSTAATLSNGTATITISAGALAAGTDSVTASYTPDTASASVYITASGTNSVTVGKVTPTVSLNLSASSITAAQSLTATVAVSGGTGGPTPTGSVTLTAGSYTSAAAVLSNGSVTITIPAGSLGNGTATLKAGYVPDTSASTIYNGATITSTVTVATAVPSVTLSLSAASVTTTQTVTATVAVSGGAGSPTVTGAVVLSGGGYTSATTALSSGSATITIPAGALAAGMDTLKATYVPDTAGAAIYSNSSGSASVTVGTTTTGVTVSLSATSITETQPLTATVTVSGGVGSPTATGAIVLSSGAYTSAAATLSGGSVSITIPAGSLAIGMDALKAAYTPDVAGSAFYGPSSGSSSVNVSAAVPAVTLNLSAASITAGQPLTATVIVSGGSGTQTPTGSITLSGGGYTSAATALATGGATITIPAGVLAIGTDALTATYTPDTAGAAIYISASGSSSVTVGKVAPTVSLNLSASSITTVQSLTATVAVSGGTGNPTPTGTVTLSGGGFTSAATTLTGGSVTIMVPAGTLSAGADTLTATYTPDAAGASVYGSGSASSLVTVAKATATVAVTLSASSITTAQALTATVAVSGGGGNPAPTGTVTLASGSYTSQQPITNGSASFTIASGTLPAGSDILQATYVPDAASLYATASLAATVTVTAAIGTTSPTITVSAAVATVTNTQTDVVTVSVAGGAAIPTGTVSLVGGTYSTQQTLLSGATTFAVPASALSNGANTLTVSYSGDVAFSPGTATATVTVVPVIASVATLNPITRGGTGGGNLTLTTGSYTGTMALSCVLNTSPNGAQSLPVCTFNPTTATLAAGSTITAPFSITTTAATAQLEHPFEWKRWGFEGSALAGLVLFMLPSRRRRPAALLMLMLGLMMAGVSGCAGGGGGSGTSGNPTSTPGTTAGTYTFTMTATDSGSKTTASANVSVLVQ